MRSQISKSPAVITSLGVSSLPVVCLMSCGVDSGLAGSPALSVPSAGSAPPTTPGSTPSLLLLRVPCPVASPPWGR